MGPFFNERSVTTAFDVKSTRADERGRVDMLTDPVAAARAVVATGAWVKSKLDMYLIRGSVAA